MYNISYGKGIADVVVRTTDKEENVVDQYSEQATKVFDAKATELLGKVEDVVFNPATHTMKKGTREDIQPEIIGVEDGLHVMWLESSNENVAKISNNIISAVSTGKTTLKGVVVPDKQIAVFDAAGNGYMKNVLDTIPENIIKTVTVDVQVRSSSSGSSSGVSNRNDTDNDDSDVKKYPNGTTVTTNVNEDGNIVSKIEAKSETEVEIPLKGNNNVLMVVTENENGEKTYITNATIKDDAVSLSVSENLSVLIICGEKTVFTDVHNVSHWSVASIDFVNALGIMKGIGEETFAPDEPLTRAMLVTMLYRTEGEPDVTGVSNFDDAEKDSWYEKAVLWAKQNGIVNGVTETEFSPNENITREQIATILHRYENYKKNDTETFETANIDNFDDAEDVSDYAEMSVKWAVGYGLIKGKTSATINPLDNATRAETAAILHRYLTNEK